MRSELVNDTLGMAVLRRNPDSRTRTVLVSDHGLQGGFKRSMQHLRRFGVLAAGGAAVLSVIERRSSVRVAGDAATRVWVGLATPSTGWLTPVPGRVLARDGERRNLHVGTPFMRCVEPKEIPCTTL